MFRLTLTCLPDEGFIAGVLDELMRDGLVPERDRGAAGRAITGGLAIEMEDEAGAREAYAKYRQMGCAVEVRKVPKSAPAPPPPRPAPPRPTARGRVGKIAERPCPSCGVSIPARAEVCPHCRKPVRRPVLPRLLKALVLLLAIAGVAYMGLRKPHVPPSPLDVAHVGGAWEACLDRARGEVAGGGGAVYPPLPDRSRGEVFFRSNTFVAHEGNYRYSVQAYARMPDGRRETFRCAVEFDTPDVAEGTARVTEFGKR
jgi:hypothetical protein